MRHSRTPLESLGFADLANTVRADHPEVARAVDYLLHRVRVAEDDLDLAQSRAVMWKTTAVTLRQTGRAVVGAVRSAGVPVDPRASAHWALALDDFDTALSSERPSAVPERA